MTHLTQKNLIATCECFLALHRPSWRNVASTIGASASLMFAWRARCNEDRKRDDTGASSPFYFKWREVDGWWTEHIERAISEFNVAYVQQVRAQAMGGIEIPVRGPDQRILYKLNPFYVARSDDYIRICEGLDGDADVAWYRLAHDAEGRSIAEVRFEQLPAPLRLRILEAADPQFRSTQNVDVNVAAKVVHIRAPLQRRADEPRPDIVELKRLALMSPAERRAQAGASAFPKDRTGLVVAAATGAARGGERSDHIREQEPIEPPPNPRAYTEPPLHAPDRPRPSYAKPARSLDGSGTGPGSPPPGGFSVVR
ncbi:MAG TPA: hypothetical protein VMV59_07030 [Candidatus Dormibacteraeota bacterium]|nr:hypothetical protein [Candidatus Dormibacteraeota bacterium]